MTTAETYNGWTNYATWGVALVLDNDQGIYNEVREQARAFKGCADTAPNVESGIWTEDEATLYGLEDWIKDYVESMCDVPDSATQHGEGIFYPLMAQQVIQAGLSEVDWAEIARNVLDDLS